jgi:integration host factor subunit alpha
MERMCSFQVLVNFSIKNKKERRGRNPATGDDMILSKRTVITFNCSSILRERLNR